MKGKSGVRLILCPSPFGVCTEKLTLPSVAAAMESQPTPWRAMSQQFVLRDWPIVVYLMGFKGGNSSKRS